MNESTKFLLVSVADRTYSTFALMLQCRV